LKINHLSVIHRILLIFNGQIEVYPTVENRQLVRKVAQSLEIQRRSKGVSEQNSRWKSKAYQAFPLHTVD